MPVAKKQKVGSCGDAGMGAKYKVVVYKFLVNSTSCLRIYLLAWENHQAKLVYKKFTRLGKQENVCGMGVCGERGVEDNGRIHLSCKIVNKLSPRGADF